MVVRESAKGCLVPRTGADFVPPQWECITEPGDLLYAPWLQRAVLLDAGP